MPYYDRHVGVSFETAIMAGILAFGAQTREAQLKKHDGACARAGAFC